MSVSVKTARRAIANQVEPRGWGIGTTTATGATDTVVASGFILSRGDQNAMDGGWLNWTAGALLGQNRPIRKSGIDTSTGTFTVATPYTATTPTATEFEVHLRYPAKRDVGSLFTAGYLDMVNDALQRLWFQDDIPVTAVAGQSRYLLDIVTHPWLAETERILDIVGPIGADNVRHLSQQSWSVNDDGEAPELILPGGMSSGTFYLRVARPAWTRIKVAGIWTDVTEASPNGGQLGVANDSDEFQARRRDVMAIAISESMGHLGMQQPLYQADEWEKRRLAWAAVAASCKRRRLPRRNNGHPRVRAVLVGGGMMGRL